MSDVLLAVDGGNSKTDVVLVAPDGRLLAALRGPTASHQAIGGPAAAASLAALVAGARSAAGLSEAGPAARLGVLCLAGADGPAYVRLLARLHGPSAIADRLVIRNDTHAALRAGSPDGWGVAVIVGAGINALGVSPGGREVRFAALGPISGDRGGGRWMGMEGLGAAVRAQDGRGPRTALERLVPARFGRRRPLDVTADLDAGRLAIERVGELAPVVADAARDGDAVALGIVDALADEVAGFAIAAIRRAGMVRRPVPVTLAGGVARGAGDLLADRVAARVRWVAPDARVGVLWEPPVLGAALLALEAAGAAPAAANEAVAGLRAGLAAALGA